MGAYMPWRSLENKPVRRHMRYDRCDVAQDIEGERV
jgi:hypothetical protein